MYITQLRFDVFDVVFSVGVSFACVLIISCLQ